MKPVPESSQMIKKMYIVWKKPLQYHMVLSTEIYRTPVKVTELSLFPKMYLKSRIKRPTAQGWNGLVLLPSVSISFGIRVAPGMPLGFRKTKVEYVNGYCHSLGVCLMWLDLA